MYPHLAIYFSSRFGRYPTLHTLTSVVQKELSVGLKNVPAFSCYSKMKKERLNMRLLPSLSNPSGQGEKVGFPEKVKGKNRLLRKKSGKD